MSVVSFLLARVEEDETAARAAMNIPAGVSRTTTSGVQQYRAAEGAASASLDEVGHWGWSGGPAVYDPSHEEQRLLGQVLGFEDAPDRPYSVGDSGLWDESEPIGAEFFRATIPAAAGEGTVRHIARHDPARVLAECRAKREVIDQWRRCAEEEVKGEPELGTTAVRQVVEWIIRILAAAYADHPAYSQEWSIHARA